MAGSKKKPIASNDDGAEAVPIDDIEFLGQAIRQVQDNSSRCLFRLRPDMPISDLLKLEATIAEFYAGAAAVRSRIQNIAVKAGKGIPRSLDFEERMALALDVHGVDPYGLEEIALDAEREQARKKIEAMRRKR